MSFENIRALLDKMQACNVPDYELIVFHNGTQVYKEVKNTSRITPEMHLFNWYSCSKFITCAATMKLFEEGKFSLDDDIAEYLPAFANITVLKNGGVYPAERRMKIRHLFTMTAGYDYNHNAQAILDGKKDTDGICPTLKMADYLARIPLCFEPGETYRYSLCHDVLPALVEVITGKRFGEYVKDTIFDPLGMNDTTYLFPDGRLNEIYPQYHARPGNVLEEIGPNILYYKFGSEYESGGAGSVGTSSDYIKFLEGMRTGKVLSLDTIELMSRPMLDEKQILDYTLSHYNYGLGVRVPLKDGKRSDIGWGGAAGSCAALDVKNGISLFYAQHVISSPASALKQDLIEAAKLDLGIGIN